MAKFLIHRITLDILCENSWKLTKIGIDGRVTWNMPKAHLHKLPCRSARRDTLFCVHILEALIKYYFLVTGPWQDCWILFYTYLCTFKAEILFVRLFSIPRILLLIVRNGMFLTTKINSIPFEFFWWIFRWYVAEAGDARSKQDILIRIVWTSHRLEFFMKSLWSLI